MNVQVIETLPSVKATLTYLAPQAEKPYSYTYDPGPGIKRTSGEPQTVDGIAIRDARPLSDRLSIDVEGFKLVTAPTRVKNFFDEAEITRTYYPEVEALLKQETGASRVVVFDHIVRSAEKVRQGVPGIKEPARRVHNDYTLASGPQRVRDLMQDEADELLKRRFAQVNVWRPIREPLQDAPLALCDARSIAQSDFVGTDLIYPHRRGEVYSLNYNPRHRWFYFPNMLRSETVLIKGYDSDPERSRFAAHTAFDDPSTPAGAAPRESIEARALLFFQ